MRKKISPRLLSQARVIAKGRGIRDVQRLVKRYGGRVARWVKKSSPQIEINGERFEYHWYEHPSIGMRELKRKQIEQL